MMYRVLLLLLMLSSCDSNEKDTDGQTNEPVFEIQQIAALDSSITESSGLVTIDEKLYTHSDMRGKAQLIQLNRDGSIASTRTFQNIDIRDWEDTTIDGEFLYIGDIGNNLGNKTDLKIYKLPVDQINSSSPSNSTITFKFGDQTDFSNTQLNQTSYDAEALVAIQDKLYVFTKDWIGLNSQVYELPKDPGIYSSTPLKTLNIGGLVTGATKSPDGSIILCGYSPTLSPFVAKILVNNGGLELDRKIDLTGMLGTASQIEGISFSGMVDGIPVYHLTSEQFQTTFAGSSITLPANLYELRWRD